MKLVDIMYIHPYYRPTEELMADPTVKDTNLACFLDSKFVQNMGSNARLASEEALKVCLYGLIDFALSFYNYSLFISIFIYMQLKDMREAQFGKLSQLVPPVDQSLRPYIPLPDSTAQPYSTPSEVSTNNTSSAIQWERASGQKLEGIMLPVPKRSDVVMFEM